MLILLNSLWLGILTSISPCPLGSNIAMVSFLSKTINNTKKTLITTFIYTLGRIFLYITLGMFLSFSIQKIGTISLFLQNYMNIIFGFVLIIVGLFILNVINFNFFNFNFLSNFKEKFKNIGYFGSFCLGVVSASAFCPVSAGLFFGNLMQNQGSILSFFIYGLGTSIPLVAVSLIIVFASNKIGTFYEKIGAFEKYSTKITAIIFILAGFYLLINYL